ncbi:MAG TPA: PD-(D/E)XK nuclease family protein [Acidimicrobiales bacterium]|nr:PD-(D/E)XK nuclease family protein [Acidimicrobiales bacterium]
MALALPRSLSPSKLSAFKDCPLAFRFSAIDRVPEEPSPHMVKGTLVHSALERLFWDHPRGARTPDAARHALAAAWESLAQSPDATALDLSADDRDAFVADAQSLLDGYFRLEDPDAVDAVGVELTLEAAMGDLRLRGIIDRLDVTPDGELVVVDYKTGRVPSVNQENQRLGGVQFYALLCEQVLGRRPSRIRLMYLREPLVIEAEPSEQAVKGTRQRTTAVWSAIARACVQEDFRPRPSALCNWCSFRPLCPVYGGDPTQAAEHAPAAADGAAVPVARAG